MARFYDITSEQLEEITRFVNDEQDTLPGTAATSALQNLFFAYQKKLAGRLNETIRKADRLEKRLNLLENKREEQAVLGNFECIDIDSVIIAKGLLYKLKGLNGYNLTKYKVIYIMYLMYASWLASHRQRLFIEHPVATEWGPHLWRVAKNIDIKTDGTIEDWRKLTQESPAVAAFTEESAKKRYLLSPDELRRLLVATAPYTNALPEKNGGKWNKEITDADIYAWKKSLK